MAVSCMNGNFFVLLVLNIFVSLAKTRYGFSDIKKFCYSNLLLGNIILENLKNLKASKFINFSTVWEDANAIKDNTVNLYAAYKLSLIHI